MTQKTYLVEKVDGEIVALQAVVVPDVLLDPTGDLVKKMLDAVRGKVSGIVFDVNDQKQRDEAKSLAYKVSRTKTAFGNPAAEFSKDLKEQPKIVDGNRKLWADEMDKIRDEIRQPVTEWEDREKAKQDAINKRIDDIRQSGIDLDGLSVDALMERLNHAAQLVADFDFSESASAAKTISDTVASRISEAIKARRDADRAAAELKAAQEELERLRKQEEDRVIAERLDAEKKEAAEQASRQARIDAEEAHKREMERIEAERVAEREAAERKAREAQEAADKAERDRLQAIEDARQESARAEQERIAALERAEIEKQEAIESERKRAADEKAQAEAEAAKREANKAHYRKVNNEAVACLVKVGLTEDQAKLAVTAIAKREVDHVQIIY